MAQGIDVSIGADTREYERAVRSGMVEPVEDAQKALEQYSDAAGDGSQRLTSTFEDQQRSTVELRRKIDELNGSIRDGARQSTGQAKGSYETFRRDTTEGFDEIRESARSNAIEVGASFTGGFDQAVGGLQGFLAEFLAGFGPGGIIAGVGIASLLGLVSQGMADGTEKAEEQRQAVADLASEYIEAGGAAKRSLDSQTAALESMATSDGSDVIITLQQAWEKSKVAGADYQGIVQAIASASPQQIAAARREVERLRQAHDDSAAAAQNDGSGTYSAAIKGAKGARELGDALDKAEGQARAAQRAAQLAARAGLSDWQRQQDLVHQVESAYDDAAGAADKFIDKQGDFNPGPYIKNVNKVREALRHYKDDLAKADLGAAAEHFLEQQGAETAAAMLRGYQKATPTQRARLREIWTTSGNENATDYGDAIGKSLKSITVEAPKVAPPRIPLPDDRALQAYLRQPKVYRMVIEGVTRQGTRVF